MPDLYRPLLQIATFCQTALLETSGVLSIIRCIDRYTVQSATPEMPSTTVDLTLVVVFKSGFMRGKAMIGIRGFTPTQKALAPVEMPVLLEGDDRGPGLVIPMALTFDEEGLYWFDILADGELVTRVPLRLMYQQIAQPFQFGTQPLST